ncbi:MAG: hypothetical protein K0Q72_2097 [Armatimonadetes bacterium]|jgi:hypothetical protein|nr:hypothetical protein [Armatimonadota bacterium]
MRKSIQTMAVAAALLAAAGTGWAAKGILFPDFSQPTKGTFEAPAAEAGVRPTSDAPWSVTTVTSSIKGKAVPGKPITAVGEVVDLSCYLQVGKHGDKHKDCGQKCARNGQPVGLVTADGTVYMLIDEEHDPRRDGLTNFRQFAVDNMANVVKINGTVTDVDKQKAIYVQGFLKK